MLVAEAPGLLMRRNLIRFFERRAAFRVNRFGFQQPHQRRRQYTALDTSRLPRVLQPSLWQSVIPKGLRSWNESKSPGSDTSKTSNPAIYFIWIYLLIGSQAIRIISVQNEFRTYMRKADLKIAKLKEVVEALQRGEQVDVESILGTGDEIQEREWEEALRELEEEDRTWAKNKKQKEAERAREATETQDASPVSDSRGIEVGQERQVSETSFRPAVFS